MGLGTSAEKSHVARCACDPYVKSIIAAAQPPRAIFAFSPMIMGPTFSESCNLLKGICQLQDAKVVPLAPHNLQANREPIERKPRRYRYRRTKGGRNPIRRFHPRDVVLHGHSLDFSWPMCAGLKGRHLTHRQTPREIRIKDNISKNRERRRISPVMPPAAATPAFHPKTKRPETREGPCSDRCQ
jgi:hypothetical protein